MKPVEYKVEKFFSQSPEHVQAMVKNMALATQNGGWEVVSMIPFGVRPSEKDNGKTFYSDTVMVLYRRQVVKETRTIVRMEPVSAAFKDQAKSQSRLNRLYDEGWKIVTTVVGRTDSAGNVMQVIHTMEKEVLRASYKGDDEDVPG